MNCWKLSQGGIAMRHKRKAGCILAMVPLLLATVSLAASGTEGDNDPSMMKREHDGSVSKKEFVKHHEWMFDQQDKNKNGSLEVEEMRGFHKMVNKMHERFEQQFPQHSTSANPH